MPSDMDRLQRALEVYLAWSNQPQPGPEAEFLAKNADLRDLLELMLQDLAEVERQGKEKQQVLGEFVLTREIGRGGMGVVYEAKQSSLERLVALKVLPAHLTLHPAAVARFKREALTAAKLEHPSIVKVFAVGSEGDTHYFAMELVEGSSLDQGIERERALPPAQRTSLQRRVAMIADVADALAFAHEAGVVHRDVKPSNILVRQDGSTVLTDFGLAREDALPSMTASGTFAGTPFYVAPEQALGNKTDIDARTDVFSLGVTLYELVTLQRPFDGETSREVIEKILKRDPPDPRRLVPDLPEDLAAIMLKALEKEREQRYPSMRAFESDLRAFVQGRPVSARKVTRVERARRWLWREPRLAAMGLAIIVVLGVSLAISLSLLFRLERTSELASAEAESKGRLLAQVQRLSDSQRLEDLAADDDKLWPPLPAQAEGLDRWLATARELLSRKPQHDTTLAELEAAARSDADTRWQLAMEKQVVQKMAELSGRQGQVERRLAFARSVEERSRTAPEAVAAWAQARQEIRAEPRYHGLDLAPQLGLLPLGKDPKSGLQEFWHLQSGRRPARDETGRLQVSETMGTVLVLVPGAKTVVGSRLPDVEHPLGSPHVDPQRESNENMREFDLDPYFLGKYELTQSQFRAIMGTNPSFLLPGRWGDHRSTVATTLRHPVECVTWPEADTFCKRAALTLPSEGQWEFACRAGTTSVFWTGDAAESLAGKENLRDKTRLSVIGLLGTESSPLDDGYVLTAPVGALAANPFGFHDMLGNVSEWCRERYMVRQDDSASRPGVPGDSVFQVIRGGSYDAHARQARAAGRFLIRGVARNGTIGLRVARNVDG